MIIDFHTHVMPPEMAAAPLWRGKCPLTIENVFEAAKVGGIDKTVISNPAHELRNMDTAQQLATVQMINRYLASLAEKHDDIYALATAQPYGGDNSCAKSRTGHQRGRLQGRYHPVFAAWHYPDDDDAMPFFELARRSMSRCSFIRPRSASARSGSMIYRLASSVGRPMDGALAIARLIVRGIFEKFPKLKLVGSHLGGGICEMIGRMDYAYRLQEEAFFLGSYEPMLIKHQPSCTI